MPGYIPPHLRNKKKDVSQSSQEILDDDFVAVPWETNKEDISSSDILNFNLVKNVEDEITKQPDLPTGWIDITVDKRTNKSIINENVNKDDLCLPLWAYDDDNDMMEFIIRDHENYQEELILSLGIEEYERIYIKHYEEEPEIDDDEMEDFQYEEEDIESDYDDI